MAEKAPEKFVVVSKTSADDKDYVRAVVHPDEESANEYLAEVKAATPWQSHESVSEKDFADASEKATQTEQEASTDNTDGDDTGKGEH